MKFFLCVLGGGGVGGCLLLRALYLLVPGAGIEPARCHHRGILSPVRLPIPPSRRRKTAIMTEFVQESNTHRIIL
jgi:hypothetical protein